MPELPEVEVVRRGLAEHAVGRRILSADITGARVAREHPGGAQGLADEIRGMRVREACRRGKFLWLALSDPAEVPDDSGSPVVPGSPDHTGGIRPAAGDTALVVHLRMSGQLLVAAPEAPAPRHTHARLGLDDGRELRFVDQRTFGFLTTDVLVPDPYSAAADPRPVPRSISHIAPDPFEEAFDLRATARRMRSRDVEIKRQLLDQGIVSGIGNIYADEALWGARIHGRRRGVRLRQRDVEALLLAAREVMGRALDAGGTSFDALYVNVNGESGRMTLDVYGREGRPCKRCGTPIVRERFMNRSSHFCPVCQRKR